jgi:hypothetical protein
MPILYPYNREPVPHIEINTPYVIEMYERSKHTGMIREIGYYTAGFWRLENGNLICLHRDVKSYSKLEEI